MGLVSIWGFPFNQLTPQLKSHLFQEFLISCIFILLLVPSRYVQPEARHQALPDVDHANPLVIHKQFKMQYHQSPNPYLQANFVQSPRSNLGSASGAT